MWIRVILWSIATALFGVQLVLHRTALNGFVLFICVIALAFSLATLKRSK
jgi:hypothetical protein